MLTWMTTIFSCWSLQLPAVASPSWTSEPTRCIIIQKATGQFTVQTACSSQFKPRIVHSSTATHIVHDNRLTSLTPLSHQLAAGLARSGQVGLDRLTSQVSQAWPDGSGQVRSRPEQVRSARAAGSRGGTRVTLRRGPTGMSLEWATLKWPLFTAPPLTLYKGHRA